MNVVGKVGNFIIGGVSSVATPFHPFGGAVDIIVVQQKDGTFRSTPWYVRFGKFQGVLKGAEEIVGINVNGVDANFHMYLDNSGEAYFVREVVSSDGSVANGVLKDSDSLEGTQDGSVNDDDNINSERDNDKLCDAEDGIYSEVQVRDERSPLGVGRIERTKSESERSFYELKDGESSYESLVELSESVSIHYDDLENLDCYVGPQNFNSEVVLVSVDGHILTAPISSSDRNTNNLQLSTSQFPPGQGTDIGDGKVDFGTDEEARPAELGTSAPEVAFENSCGVTSGSDASVQQLEVCEGDGKHVCQVQVSESIVDQKRELCANSNQEATSALAMQDRNDEQKDNSQDCLDLPVEPTGTICLDQDETPKAADDGHGVASTPSSRWLWSIPFRTANTIESTSGNTSSEKVFVDSQSGSQNQPVGLASTPTPQKQLLRTNVPTTEQIASLKLTEGQNIVTFSFSTRVLGMQKVDAHIYLWKWNTRIVISDVDGTITKSDVLGQFMPLVGKDWTQTGVARLFSAIKENGYQLLFLSARAIVQAYLTRSFLLNLKQGLVLYLEPIYVPHLVPRMSDTGPSPGIKLDGKTLPNGPVVISPDGLFPSLFREVIRRAPHEFKIACLEDIKALFPSDCNPFYAGFGNRDTDELSYRKMGIPKGKIFIINPKGEVAISQSIDVKSYTSLHTLVNDMFPPTLMDEEEDYNQWNYWRLPLLDVDC